MTWSIQAIEQKATKETIPIFDQKLNSFFIAKNPALYR